MSDSVRSHRSGKSSSWNSKSSKINSDAAKTAENQHLDSLPKLNTGRKLNATTGIRAQLERELSKHRKRFPSLLVKQITTSSERLFEKDACGRSHLYSETRVGFQRCISGIMTTKIMASYRTSKSSRKLLSEPPIWQPVVSITNQRILKIIPPISPLETERKCLERDGFNRKEKGLTTSDISVEEEEKISEDHKICSIYDQKSSLKSDSEEAKHIASVIDYTNGLNLSSSETTSTSNNTAVSVNRKSRKVKLKSILLNINHKMSSVCGGSHDEDNLEELSVSRNSGISGNDLRSSDAGKGAETRPGICERSLIILSERDNNKSSRRGESSTFATKGGKKKTRKRRNLSRSLRCRIVYQSEDEGAGETTSDGSCNLDPRSTENNSRASRSREHDTSSTSPLIYRKNRPTKAAERKGLDSDSRTVEYQEKTGVDKAAGSENGLTDVKIQNDPEETESIVFGREHLDRLSGYPSSRRSRGTNAEALQDSKSSTPVPQGGPGHQYASDAVFSPCSSPISAAAAGDELSSLPEGPFNRQNLQRRSSSIDSNFSRPGSDFLEVPLFMIQARDRSPSICVMDDPGVAPAAVESSPPVNSPVGDEVFHCGGDLQQQVVHRMNNLVRLPPVTPCQSPVETDGGGQQQQQVGTEQVGRGGGLDIAAAPQVSLTTEDGDDFAVWFGRRGSIFIEEKGVTQIPRQAATVTRNEHGQVSLAVPKTSN